MNAATQTDQTAAPAVVFPTRMESTQTDMGNNRRAVEGKVYESRKGLRNPGPNPDAIHPWERAGLGVAPYRLVGSGVVTYQACHGAPVQPGTSCDYCGQGIMNVFNIQGACKSVFKVGCDCVVKVCSKAEGVRTAVESAERKHRNGLAKAARERRDAANKAALADIRAAHGDLWASMPHPRAADSAFFASKSALDWFDYMLGVCGAKGRSELIKSETLRALIKAAA